MKETFGTKAARENRAICNKMTDEERSAATERGMRLVYASKPSVEEAAKLSFKKYGPAYKRLAQS